MKIDNSGSAAAPTRWSGRAPRSIQRAGTGALITAAALVATFTNSPGSIAADARYEHLADPVQFLQRHASVWDDHRNLGAPTRYFSPVLASLQALMQELGTAPWVIERLTHTLLLAAAGIGAMALFRLVFSGRFRHPGPAALVVGLLYAFGPYSSQYLVPSGLFVAYAIAPWLGVFALRGSAPGADRWRWAAATALLVFSVGILNTPALVLAGIPALALTLVAVADRGATWRGSWQWAWRALAATVLVSLPMLFTLALGGDSVQANLDTTETPAIVAVTSSASESWRGLGFWLSYFTLGNVPLRPQAGWYFSHPLVIVASFVPVVAAGAALLVVRSRRMAGLAVMAALATVLMVGIHPSPGPTPFGRALEELFDASTIARGFRSTYKAGSVLQLGVALMVGALVAALWRGPDQRRRRAPALAGVAALVGVSVGVAGYPFWTGDLYTPSELHDSVPAYWQEALEWFDDQPHEPAVLVLPGSARTDYRWGFVNDNLFDAFLQQPAVASQTLPQSTQVLADLTDAIAQHAASPGYRPGSLAPILRRMGVRWILLQNDVDWQASALSRPAAYRHVRDDADFALVASFGDAGHNVTGAGTSDADTPYEQSLAPIEVYELAGPRPDAGVASSRSIVVAGGGEAWPALAVAGWLDTPVRYLADVDIDDPGAMAGVDAVIFTDGGSRRATQATSSQKYASHVLAVDEPIERPPRPLFAAVEDQAVATYEDLETVTASAYGPALTVWDAGWRPANAVDGDPRTAWGVTVLGSPTLTVRLTEPTDLAELTLTPYASRPDQAVVVAHDIVLRDRSGAPIPDADGDVTRRVEGAVTDDAVTLTLGARDVDEVSVTLVAGDAPAQLLLLEGIAELELIGPDGPLDTREVIRVAGPAPGEAEQLAQTLDGIASHHLFTRVRGRLPFAEEAAVRREFWSPATTDRVTALVRVGDETPDEVIDHLLGAPVGAYATKRFAGALGSSAVGVLDPDLATAWQLDPGDLGDLTLRLGGRRADQVELWMISEGSTPLGTSRLTAFDVDIVSLDGQVLGRQVELPSDPVCDPAFQLLGVRCMERIAVDFPAREVATLLIRPREAQRQEAAGVVAPVQVAGVVMRLEGIDLVTPDDVAPGTGCRELMRIDGEPVSMRPTGAVSLDALQQGIEFESCGEVTLATGWHRLETVPEAAWAVSTIAMDPVGAAARAPVVTPLTARGDGTSFTVTASVAPGSLVVTDAAAHRGWHVDADGVAGTATRADGFVAWQAAGAGDVRLTVRFRPQRTYERLWIVASAALAVCVWLCLPRRRCRGVSGPEVIGGERQSDNPSDPTSEHGAPVHVRS